MVQIFLDKSIRKIHAFSYIICFRQTFEQYEIFTDVYTYLSI